MRSARFLEDPNRRAAVVVDVDRALRVEALPSPEMRVALDHAELLPSLETRAAVAVVVQIVAREKK